MPRVRPDAKILIVRLSALGDIVHTLPALDALRRALPRAHIAWLVEVASATLLEAHPQLDRLWVLDRKRAQRELFARPVATARRLGALASEIRAQRYDWVLDFQGNMRSAVCSVASGARRRVGFAAGHTPEMSYVFYHDKVTPPPGRYHRVRRNLSLVESLGVDTAGARARLGASAEARGAMAPFFASLPPGPRVAIHPGVSAFGAFKLWEPERFAEVAARLHAEHGAVAVVTWGPGERALAEAVVRCAGADVALLAPQTRSLQELMALYEGVELVIGSDTGPVHLAAALGTDVVALYGPKDPRIHAPWSARTGAPAATVWRHLDCSPCTLRRCPHASCMRLIRPEHVLPEAKRLLRDSAGLTRQGS
jgi:lipopolysaccharide heptosyltransferase I